MLARLGGGARAHPWLPAGDSRPGADGPSADDSCGAVGRPTAARTRSRMAGGRPSATTRRAVTAAGPSGVEVSQPAATSGAYEPASPMPTPAPATTASPTAT